MAWSTRLCLAWLRVSRYRVFVHCTAGSCPSLSSPMSILPGIKSLGVTLPDYFSSIIFREALLRLCAALVESPPNHYLQHSFQESTLALDSCTR